MGELICHLFGDYIIQNHWMAMNKPKSSLAAFVHALTYTLPFLFLTRSPLVLAIIFGTHFVIDRFSLAKKWPQFWGVGCEGWVGRKIREFHLDNALMSMECRFEMTEEQIQSQFAPPVDAPVWLSVWLAIIVDNAFHLLINHLALTFCA